VVESVGDVMAAERKSRRRERERKDFIELI
jgi:hypothetical protein